MTFKNFLLNQIEIHRQFEMHISKEESLERLSELVEDGHYNGEIKSYMFRLYPKNNFDIFSFYDTEIIGKFKSNDFPISLEITVKRISWFLYFCYFVDLFFILFVIISFFSDSSFSNSFITGLIIIGTTVILRLTCMDRVDKSEKVFLGYLTYLFKPLELRIKKNTTDNNRL
jgi:hypothetical protein